jgi:DNA gyrase subunit B
MNDKALSDIVDQVTEKLALSRGAITLHSDEVHGCKLVRYVNSNGTRYIVDFDFGLFSSAEYRDLLRSSAELKGYGEGPHAVSVNGEERVLESFDELLPLVDEVTRKGLTVQRYKGLGEMNPDQLWDTTMNPETRSLLKVKLEDFSEADEIFTVLMGDQVEPRREFIEDNALQVRNLDI